MLRITDETKKEKDLKFANFSTLIAIISLYTYTLHPHFQTLVLIINVCFIYLTIKLSRSLAWMEDNKKPDMVIIVKYFLLIWLFPLGVWIIQPKIRKYIEN